jgi:hypothetical protein
VRVSKSTANLQVKAFLKVQQHAVFACLTYLVLTFDQLIKSKHCFCLAVLIFDEQCQAPA